MKNIEQLLSKNNVNEYFNINAKDFVGEVFSDEEKSNVRDMNLAIEYEPELENKILDIYLEPISSTYSGMKVIFQSDNDKPDKITAISGFTDADWNLIKKAAASSDGVLCDAINEKINKEQGFEKNEFIVDIPLDINVSLHCEVKKVGAQWLIIPTSAIHTVIYISNDGSEQKQTKYKNLSLNLEELKNKVVVLEDDRIIIRKK